jgi:hypothetical protein
MNTFLLIIIIIVGFFTVFFTLAYLFGHITATCDDGTSCYINAMNGNWCTKNSIVDDRTTCCHRDEQYSLNGDTYCCKSPNKICSQDNQCCAKCSDDGYCIEFPIPLPIPIPPIPIPTSAPIQSNVSCNGVKCKSDESCALSQLNNELGTSGTSICCPSDRIVPFESGNNQCCPQVKCSDNSCCFPNPDGSIDPCKLRPDGSATTCCPAKVVCGDYCCYDGCDSTGTKCKSS